MCVCCLVTNVSVVFLQTNPNNDDIQIIPENEYCKSTYMSYFVGAIYAYKGLLMVSCGFDT